MEKSEVASQWTQAISVWRGGSLTPPHSISLAFSFPASKMGKEAASPVPDALCPLQGRMGRRMSIPLYCHFSDMSHQTQQPESGP